MSEDKRDVALCEKGCNRPVVTASDTVDVANVFDSRPVVMFGRADVLCSVVWAARCRLKFECVAKCVGLCLLCKLMAYVSTQAAEAGALFAGRCLYLNAFCG